MSQGFRTSQRDAVLLAVVEGGDRAELGMQLDEEVVERAHLLNVGQVAQAENKERLINFFMYLTKRSTLRSAYMGLGL